MRLAAPLLAVTLSAISAGAAMADDHNRDDNRRAARGHHAERANPQNNEPANRARQQFPGARVLSVQPTDDGRHRVKVLKDGEVHVVIDPEPEQNR